VTKEIDPLSEKSGVELIEHMYFYGASESELESLTREQRETLSAAGMFYG
jgi:hypothetical protein